VRANILLGDVADAQGEHREAIKTWRQIEHQDARYLGEVAGRIAASFRQLGDSDGMYNFFRDSVAKNGGNALALTLAQIIHDRDGIEAAEKFVVDWMRHRPNVHGLDRLIDLNIEEATGASKDDLRLLKGIISDLREQHLGYTCDQCGFRGRALHWQCPGCKRWNTVRPVQEE
jgi:lipopolysaccharide biosynthesis regulator YciM